MKTAERGKAQEIEMEGATIKGAMPTFKNLTKTIVYPNRLGARDINSKPLSRRYQVRPRDIYNPTGQIFTLPTGKQIVLVPEDEISEFLLDDTVVGKDTNEARENWNRYGHSSEDTWESIREEWRREYGGRLPPHLRDEGVDARRVMRPEAAEAYRKAVEGDVFADPRFASHHLGGGFHVLLGVEQQYQPDKSSFGTYEMTADGPVRVDDKEPTTKSIPIVFYSPNKPIEYMRTVGPYDKERAERGLEQTSEKASYPSLTMNILNPSGRLARKHGMGTYDTGAAYYNVRKSEIKPELIPAFTARDIIDGYKAAKAAPKAKPAKAAPSPEPPAPIEPAPPPEPVPEPPSSFQGFEMPVVDTLKGRRRKAKRRFSERQELTDE